MSECGGLLISANAWAHCTFQTVRFPPVPTKSHQFPSLICSGFAAAMRFGIGFNDRYRLDADFLGCEIKPPHLSGAMIIPAANRTGDHPGVCSRAWRSSMSIV